MPGVLATNNLNGWNFGARVGTLYPLQKEEAACKEPGQTEPFTSQSDELVFKGGGGVRGGPLAASPVADYASSNWHLQVSKGFGGVYGAGVDRWYVDPTVSYDSFTNPYRIMFQTKAGLVLNHQFGVGAIIGAGGLWAKSTTTCGVELDRTSPRINIVDDSGASIGENTVSGGTLPTYQVNKTDTYKYRAFLFSPGFELGYRISHRFSFEMPMVWYLAAPKDGMIDQQFTTFEALPHFNLRSGSFVVYAGVDALSVFKKVSYPWFLGWDFGLSAEF